MRFRDWLANFTAEESAIGDIARDVHADTSWPDEEPEDLELYREHLEAMGADSNALVALEHAWERYEEQRA